MKKFVSLAVILMFSAFAKAQCAMCRAVIESEGDGKVAEGINNGITYLMVFPYILVGGIIFFIYRNTRNRQNEEN